MRFFPLILGALAFALGCSAAPEAPPEAPVARPLSARAVSFSYRTLRGDELSNGTLRGRVSVIAFIATYDTASQAEAQFLMGALRKHTPRINVATVVLEPEENRPLVEVFVGAFDIQGPVAMADAETRAGRGPFAGLHHVPSLVFLDKQGREVYRHIGLLGPDDLERALIAVERGEAP